MNVPARNTAPTVLVAAFGVAFAAVIGLGFHSGAIAFSFSPDGRVYVDVARHTLAGDGMVRSWTHWDDPRDTAPMVHYAPGYPLALAASSAIARCDPTAAAPWLSATLMGLLMVEGAWLVWLLTRRRTLSLLAMGMVALLKVTLICHMQALSEPLFLTSLLGTLICLVLHARSGMARHAVAAAVAAGLCMFTRYQGAFLLPLGVAWFMVVMDGPWRRRVTLGTAWAAVATLPVACWQLRNVLTAADQPVRHLGVHWPDYGLLWSMFNTISAWFSPAVWPGSWKLTVVALIAAITVASLLKLGHGRWVTLAGLVCGGQMMFLIVVRTFLDAAVPFDDRILSSIGVLAVLSLVVACDHRSRHRVLTVSCTALLGLCVATQWGHWRTLTTPPRSRPTATPEWVDRLSDTATRQAVFSNRAGEIIWHAGRPAKYLPEGRSATILRDLLDRLSETAGIVVYFHANSGREHLLPLSMLLERSELVAINTRHATLLTVRRDATAAMAEPRTAQ